MQNTQNQYALLIGSQILGLLGTHNDVEAMGMALATRGFEITRCTEAGASRAGILAAYRSLIERVKPDDVVVVYYSGHGGFAEDKTGHRIQYILPTDWVEDDNIFNGIIDSELADLLAQLTEKTTNVAVILDCCHSSLLSRGGEPSPELVSRAVAGRWTRGLANHVANAPSRAYVTGNPHAVRLAAAEADREAFESDQEVDGKLVRRGLLTRALEQILQEPGSAALSWRGVCSRVREQVLARARMQRPSLEGPADRTLFTTSEQTRPDAVVYFDDRGKPVLRTSRILGAGVGVSYDILRRGATVVSEGTRVATATITEFDGSKALVALSEIREPPQGGALAFPRRSLFPAMSTLLTGRDNSGLRAGLAESSLVALVDRESARFVIETTDDAIVLTDRADGVSSSLRLDDTPQGHMLAKQWIERWAKAEALRALPSGGLNDQAVELTWGCAVDGELIRRGPGDPFRVGEKICLYVKNTSAQPLYLWVIDIGVFGKVTIISGVAEGQRITPGNRLAIGDDQQVPVGLDLEWPEDRVAAVGPRRESLMVLAANHWVDVSVFETPDLVFRSKGGTSSDLEDLLRSFGAGTARDIGANKVGQVYGVRRIDFDLDPRTPSSAGVLA